MKENKPKKIEISADATVKKAPEKAEINMLICKGGAKRKIDKVREDFIEMKKELFEAGVKEKDIETTGYNISKVSENILTKEYVITHFVKITVNNLEKIGEVMDIIHNYEDTTICGVSFNIGNETLEKLKIEAYKKAGKKLRDIARAIATTTGAKLGKPLMISEKGFVCNDPDEFKPERDKYYRMRKFSSLACSKNITNTSEYKQTENMQPTDINIKEQSVYVKLYGIFAIN